MYNLCYNGGMTKRFTIPAPDELHRLAKAKAAKDDISLTTVICRLVCGWLNGEIELPECGEPEPASPYFADGGLSVRSGALSGYAVWL